MEDIINGYLLLILFIVIISLNIYAVTILGILSNKYNFKVKRKGFLFGRIKIIINQDAIKSIAVSRLYNRYKFVNRALKISRIIFIIYFIILIVINIRSSN